MVQPVTSAFLTLLILTEMRSSNIFCFFRVYWKDRDGIHSCWKLLYSYCTTKNLYWVRVNCHTKIAEKKTTYLNREQMLELTFFIKTKELSLTKKLISIMWGSFCSTGLAEWQVYFRSSIFRKTKDFKYNFMSQTQCTCYYMLRSIYLGSILALVCLCHKCL